MSERWQAHTKPGLELLELLLFLLKAPKPAKKNTYRDANSLSQIGISCNAQDSKTSSKAK